MFSDQEDGRYVETSEMQQDLLVCGLRKLYDIACQGGLQTEPISGGKSGHPLTTDPLARLGTPDIYQENVLFEHTEDLKQLTLRREPTTTDEQEDSVSVQAAKSPAHHDLAQARESTRLTINGQSSRIQPRTSGSREPENMATQEDVVEATNLYADSVSAADSLYYSQLGATSEILPSSLSTSPPLNDQFQSDEFITFPTMTWGTPTFGQSLLIDQPAKYYPN
ncbi:hypothetical protein IFM61606_10380 [Aspergillus udagawae]|nr:hypothetical protein IFM61606_10380 [Aspergillus udagawae]